MLNYDELEILMEALDSWMIKDRAGNLISSLFDKLLARDVDDDKKKKIDQEIEENSKRMIQDEKDRGRKTIIIKAKLIQLQEKLLDGKSELTIKDIID